MTELHTVYIESTTAAALAAEAARTGRPLAEVYREHLNEPEGALRVRVVNMDDRMLELLAQGLPWSEVVRLAFEAAP